MYKKHININQSESALGCLHLSIIANVRVLKADMQPFHSPPQSQSCRTTHAKHNGSSSCHALDLCNWRKKKQTAAEAENIKHGKSLVKIRAVKENRKLSQFKNNEPTYGSFPLF